jgi:galactonate dehydratase
LRITGARIFLIRSGRFHPVLLELQTDEGITGLGEAGIAYGMGGTAAAGMLKDFCESMVMGRDPFRIEELWSEMYDHSFWAKGGGPIVFAAISAIETALWDIKGKALVVPVHEFLGGRFRDTVPVYANGWCSGTATPAEFARAGARPVEQGFGALKCYPLGVRSQSGAMRHVSRRAIDREAADLAFAKVKALRDAIGPGPRLFLDISGGLTTEESIRLIRRWEELDIWYVEEPADPFDIEAVKTIHAKTDTPIALGERLYTRHDFRRVFESGAVALAQPDIGNTGGIMEVKKIAAMAEAYNMRIQPHVCGSAVAMAAALQIDACIPNLLIQECYPYMAEEPSHVHVVHEVPERTIRDGMIRIPTGPGLGVTLNEPAVAPFQWAAVGAAG